MATVTLKKAPDAFTSVEDPETGARFRLGVEVEDVDGEVVDRLKAMAAGDDHKGFEFDFGGSAPDSGGVRGTLPTNASAPVAGVDGGVS